MADLQQLIQQKAALERQIAQAQAQTRQDAIGQIRKLMDEAGLSISDLASAPRAKIAKGDPTRKPVAAKYRDNQGNAWSGRGLKPKWLTAALANGKKLEDFAI
jgi:DNA-binding protein H-NS